MGTINQGILGGFRGKVGNVVGFFWKGQAVMRSLAGSVANPRTPAQLAQRARFSVAGSLVRVFTNVVNNTVNLPTSYSSTAKRKSKINVMMQNILRSLSYNGADASLMTAYDVTWSNLEVSQREGAFGSLVPTNIAASYDAAQRQLNLSWTDNTSMAPYIGATDVIGIVVVPSQRDDAGKFVYPFALMNDGDFERHDQAGSITIPQGTMGNQVEVYVFARNAVGTERSASYYAGSVALTE